MLRVILIWMISLAWGLVLTQTSPVYGRTIQWSGHEWLVRNSDNERGGPGPTFGRIHPRVSGSNSNDRLHLKIRYETVDGFAQKFSILNHWAMADIYSWWLAPWVKWTCKPSWAYSCMPMMPMRSISSCLDGVKIVGLAITSLLCIPCEGVKHSYAVTSAVDRLVQRMAFAGTLLVFYSKFRQSPCTR